MPSVKHIVLLKFKASATRQTVEKLFGDLAALQSLIPGIDDLIWGPNISTEGLAQGFTHGFIMTFRDVAARDGYLPHPAHERVKAAILPVIEGVLVYDFET
ncbi:Dabb family protein [Candidatus Sumerlaeota bacterium]|nr:Dabb family protein [Candidatus Sumerlaeota bacterium]